MEGEGYVDEREIFSSDSSDGEAYGGGAYGGYEAQVLDGSVTVDHGEYFSDESADPTNTTTTYRTHHAPPTPPRPRDGEGAFRAIVEDC